MSEMKSLTIGSNTYEVVDAVARANSSSGNVDIPKIYKWEKRKKELDSYNTGSSTKYSSTFEPLIQLSGYYAKGYKTAKDAFLRPSNAETYDYVGKTSINSEYPYVYFASLSNVMSSGTGWTEGVYKITSISIVEKKTQVYGDYYNYSYTYNFTGQLLTNPVYSENLIEYKYGLSEEYSKLFPTSTEISYVLTNPD